MGDHVLDRRTTNESKGQDVRMVLQFSKQMYKLRALVELVTEGHTDEDIQIMPMIYRKCSNFVMPDPSFSSCFISYDDTDENNDEGRISIKISRPGKITIRYPSFIKYGNLKKAGEICIIINRWDGSFFVIRSIDGNKTQDTSDQTHDRNQSRCILSLVEIFHRFFCHWLFHTNRWCHARHGILRYDHCNN